MNLKTEYNNYFCKDCIGSLENFYLEVKKIECLTKIEGSYDLVYDGITYPKENFIMDLEKWGDKLDSLSIDLLKLRIQECSNNL